jgi:hypothetical protein
MSDGLDFLGRFEAAHFAALSFACLALSAVLGRKIAKIMVRNI